MASTEDHILQGIDILKQPGSPGIINIISQDAQPIVNTKKGTILAVSELGKGRIVAISHDSYVTGIDSDDSSGPYSKLQENIKQWITHGTGASSIEIQVIDGGTKDIDFGSKVLVFTGIIASTNLSDDVVRDFVSNGGGFIHGVTPWGWSQLNKGKAIAHIPYYSLLTSVGIQYRANAVGSADEGIAIGKGDVSITPLVDKEMPMLQKLLCDPYVASVRETRQTILEDLTSVPVIGIPGTIVCFGPQAFAVLCGESPCDIIVAASTFGNGKVVVFSHNGYSNTNKSSLFNNVLNWLAGSKAKHSYATLDKSLTRNDMSKHSIILCLAKENTCITSDDIVNYIHQGGMFVYSATPWGWLQLNPGKSLDQMPYYNVLELAGLIYTDNYCSAKNSIKVDLGEDATIEHAMKNISYVMKYAMHSIHSINKYSGCLRCVPYLPQNVKQCLKADTCEVIRKILPSISLPTPQRSLKKPHEKALAAFAFEIHQDQCIDKVSRMISDFPGETHPDCPQAHKTVSFCGSIKQCYPTSIYLPPGCTVKVSILNKEDANKGWNIQIGCHSDNISHCNEWKRWPCIFKKLDLTDDMEMSSQFGGLIYICNPGFKAEEKIEVSLTGGILAPNFDINDPEGHIKWQTRFDPYSPWIDLIGNYIQLTVPAECVKDINDPTEAIKAWDSVVLAHHALRGTKPNRREWIVCDVQISAGYMHAGYPIMTHLDITKPCSDSHLFDADKIKSRHSWGLYHEIGHNMQRPLWTFEGTGEVTVNIFSLHAMDKIAGIEPWIHPWLQNSLPNMKTALNGGNTYKTWLSNPGVALGVYAQLQHYFGWDHYTDVFQIYEAMKEREKPKSNQQKIDTWIELFSKAVNKNLCPLFAFWEIPFTESVTQAVQELEIFFPDDEMTRLAPSRMEDIKAMFS